MIAVRRALATLGVALLAAGCTEPQRTETIHHWNTAESMLFDAQAADDALHVVRRTAVRTVLEAYTADGRVDRRAFIDKPITSVLAAGSIVYYAEEIAPGRNRIIRLEQDGTKNIVSQDGNWTEIVRGPKGEVYGVESLFLTRDQAPSSGRIMNLTHGRVVFEDNASYHYPFGGSVLLLVSPLDRQVRVLDNGRARPVGSLTSMENPPIVSADRSKIVWFGPGAGGSSLYLCDAAGIVSEFQPSLTERPIAWLGDDLAVAYQDALNTRWILKRIGVPDGLIKATIPVPPDIRPEGFKGSPRGDFVGFATERGSTIIRLVDGFIQEFPEPLSAWRFSEDGRRLWLVTQSDLRVIDLK